MALREDIMTAVINGAKNSDNSPDEEAEGQVEGGVHASV